MTLPSSGGLTIAQILAEIGDTYPVTIPNANWRTLAGKPTGPLVIPTDFYGKSWAPTIISQVDSRNDAGGSSPHTFSSVNFGPDYASRVIVVCILSQGTGSGAINQTGVTIGGVAAVGDNDGQNLSGATIVGCGMWAAKPTGTSGSVVITWSGVAANAIGIVVLSVPMSSATHTDSFSPVYTVNSQNTTTGTSTLNIPTNGVQIVAAAHRNTNDAVFDAGVTKRSTITLAASNMIVGWDQNQTLQAGKSFSASWSGNATRGFQGRAFNP